MIPIKYSTSFFLNLTHLIPLILLSVIPFNPAYAGTGKIIEAFLGRAIEEVHDHAGTVKNRGLGNKKQRSSDNTPYIEIEISDSDIQYQMATLHCPKESHDSGGDDSVRNSPNSERRNKRMEQEESTQQIFYSLKDTALEIYPGNHRIRIKTKIVTLQQHQTALKALTPFSSENTNIDLKVSSSQYKDPKQNILTLMIEGISPDAKNPIYRIWDPHIYGSAEEYIWDTHLLLKGKKSASQKVLSPFDNLPFTRTRNILDWFFSSRLKGNPIDINSTDSKIQHLYYESICKNETQSPMQEELSYCEELSFKNLDDDTIIIYGRASSQLTSEKKLGLVFLESPDSQLPLPMVANLLGCTLDPPFPHDEDAIGVEMEYALQQIYRLGLNSKKDRNPPQLRGSNRKNKGKNKLERKYHYDADKRLPPPAQGATNSQISHLEDKSEFRDQHKGASPAGTEKRHVRRNISFKGITPDTPNSYVLKTQRHAEFNKKIKWKKLKKTSRRRVKNALLQKNNPLPRIAEQPAY